MNCGACDFTTVSSEELFKKLDSFIDGLHIDRYDPRRRGHLIEVLHRAQKLFGYLPTHVQKHVAEKLNLHHADVSGVVSFYNFFSTTPKGRYNVNVCLGTACYVKGAGKVLDEFSRALGVQEGGVTPDGKFSLSVLRCVGACGLAPVVLVNERVYGQVKPEDVKNILKEFEGEA